MRRARFLAMRAERVYPHDGIVPLLVFCGFFVRIALPIDFRALRIALFRALTSFREIFALCFCDAIRAASFDCCACASAGVASPRLRMSPEIRTREVFFTCISSGILPRFYLQRWPSASPARVTCRMRSADLGNPVRVFTANSLFPTAPST